MQKPATCRHCKEEFTPYPGKPGFVDECMDCIRPPEPVKMAAPERKPAKRQFHYKSPAHAARAFNRNLLGMLKLIVEIDPTFAEDFRHAHFHGLQREGLTPFDPTPGMKE